MVAFMTELASEAWSALHIERLLNASAEMAALGPAILGVTMGIGRLIGQYAFERLDELQVVRGGAALSALGAILAAQAMGPWMVYLGFGLLGFGVSVMVPMLFSHVGNVIPEAQRSAAISRVAVIGYFGFFIGPPMMGFLSEWGSLRVSFTAIALMLVCVVIGLRQPRG
jgi:MFS family permease